MTDLEIRITSRNQAAGGLAGVTRDVQRLRNEFKAVEAAAKIDSKVSVDDSEIMAAERDLRDLDGIDANTRVRVDDSEIDEAERGIRGLDSIPDPTIDALIRLDDRQIEAEAADGVAGIEDTFGGIDLRDMSGSIVSQMGSLMSGAGPLIGIVGAGAALFGDELAAGISAGFNANRNKVDLSIRSGLEGVDLEAAGRAGGAAYAAGFGESAADMRFAAAGLKQELEGLDFGDSLEQITKQAALLEEKFGIDIPRSADIVRRMIANDMAPDVVSALNSIFQVAQELPFTFDEALDVMTEYAPTLGKMNLSTGELVAWLGKVERSGAFENIDKGADALREFNNLLLETDTFDDVFSEMGLNIERMQEAWQNGNASDVIDTIADSLINMEDQTRAAELAGILFGSAVQDVSDRMAAVDALRFDETMSSTAQSLDDATRAAEDNVSGMERAKRAAFDLGQVYGQQLNAKLEEGFSIWDKAKGLFTDTGDAVEEVAGQVQRSSGSFDDFADVLDNELNPGLTDAEAAAAELEGALQSLSDWASGSGEAALRGVHEAADQITESFTATIAETFSLRDGWNLLEEEGRAGSEMMAGLRADVGRLTEQFLEGKVGPEQFRSAMADLESNLRTAADAAGLDKNAIDALVDSALSVPSNVTLEVEARTEAASTNVQRFKDKLAALNGQTANTFVNNSITTTYRTYEVRGVLPTTRGRAHGGVVGAAADGGPQTGALTLVNEGGQESARLPDGDLVMLPTGSTVNTAEDTTRLIQQGEFGGGGGGGPTLIVNVLGTVTAERDLMGLIQDQLHQVTLASDG